MQFLYILILYIFKGKLGENKILDNIISRFVNNFIGAFTPLMSFSEYCMKYSLYVNASASYTNNFSSMSIFDSNFSLCSNIPMPVFSSGFSSSYNITSSAAAGRVLASPEGMTLKGKGPGTQYGPEFLAKVKQIAQKINCDYRDLIAVMDAESGIQTNRWNGRTAVGLIQFTQVTCDEFKRVYGLNVTKDQIARMSVLEQLDLVDKYFQMTLNANPRLKGKKISRGDLYALVFLPGRSEREILCTRDEREHPEYYRQNRGLDLNKDGKITKSELAQRVSDCYVTDASFLS